MAKLFFGMNASLDGYVDHDRFAPDPALFQHFIRQTQGLTGSLYGRRLYEIMRYWDDERPEWGEPERAFAAAWRSKPKWVASRTLREVGPNATLIDTDIEAFAHKLKREYPGEIEVGGPKLARHLTELGLIDEYWVYLHPVVLGQGAPYFAASPPPLRLIANERIGANAIKLTYAPA